MPMQKQTWRISGLSVELGIDRQTLAKRLETLRPVETEGKSRLYHMADVSRHLGKQDNTAQENEIDEETKAVTAEYLSGAFSGFYDEWASPLSQYLWKATKLFPAFTGDNILKMIESIWTIQLDNSGGHVKQMVS